MVGMYRKLASIPTILPYILLLGMVRYHKVEYVSVGSKGIGIHIELEPFFEPPVYIVPSVSPR